MASEFHLQVMRIIAPLTVRHGFAIAGGQALALNGYAVRPTEDIDAFTNRAALNIAVVVDEVAAELRGHGLTVEIESEVTNENFGRISVKSGVDEVKIEFALDFRAHEPRLTEWGMVLHPIDSAASKMSAFWGRREVRDAIDIYMLVRSLDFSRESLSAMLAASEPAFTPASFQPALQAASAYSDEKFALYAIDQTEAEAIRHFFRDWVAATTG